VNTTRGAVVDQRALYEALRAEVIAAAALDVTEVEPIPMDDPILTLPNVLIAPHIASASQGSRARMADLAARNLLAALNGEPMPACANLEALGQRRV
jgi:glyoxylate reductase